MLENLKDLLTKEPILVLNMIKAVIGLLAAFGLVLNDFQTAAIVAFAGSLMVLLSSLLADRSLVSPAVRKKAPKKRTLTREKDMV